MSLQIRDPRSRGRSKSPGGRERSRSRDARVPSPPKEKKKVVEQTITKKYYEEDVEEDDRRSRAKKSSKKYDESESEEEDRNRHKKSSKKYDKSDSEEERRSHHKKSSKKYSESSSSEESDRHRKKSLSKKYHESDSDEKPKHKKSLKSHAHESDSEESDHRRAKSKKSSKKHYDSDSSEGSPKHRHAPEPPSSKHRPQYDRAPGSHPSYAQPTQYGYAQSGQYPPPPPAPPADYHATRHASYTDARHDEYGRPIAMPMNPQDRTLGLNTAGFTNGMGPTSPRPQYASPTQYAPPGAFPSGHSDIPDHQRVHSISAQGSQAYVQPQRYEYAQVGPDIKYKSKSDKQYTQAHEQQLVKPYRQSEDPQYVEVRPGRHEREKFERRDSDRDRRTKHASPPSDGLVPRMHSLSVSGASALTVATTGGHGDGGKPPASPLLEAYRGTYQSISPMPSPIMGAGKYDDDEISDLDSLGHSDSDGHGRKSKPRRENERPHPPHRKSSESTATMEVRSPTTSRKRVSFYDPGADAKALAAALSHHTRVETKPIITILPSLSTDDILELRTEYKNHAKMGGKGINIAKHIKLKVPGNLGKAAYATALGRWESEAYWANSWYQAGTSRRELLIESLMGRTNSDIREIKNSFSDKRYSDSLEKCMKAELKADKFRVAILLALEEKRMSDSQPLSIELVKRDVQDLNRALTSREGGETAMIQIIVMRSDAHIREVMHVYEASYRKNFAREMIGKSRNLVGETLAHIINGALNRPMRDALLLHQAISESGTGKDRAELLISRLVRLHWEPKHLERVKQEYRRRYGGKIEDKIEEEVGKGSEWGDFCIELSKSSSR